MRNKFILIAVIALAIGAAFFWRSHSSKDEQQNQAGMQMPAPEVVTAVVQPQAVDLSKELPGRTSAYRISEIRPQVNGIILKRLFEEGSDVVVGQQLYQIDPAVYKAAVDSGQADLMKAQANSKSVIAKDARYAELVKIGGVSKQEYDDIKASVAQSNADIAIAAAALTNAKINLEYTKVLSPIAGRIGKSAVTEGALVTANQTTALATVQQLDPIYVDVTQSSAELMALRRDMGANSDPTKKLPVTLTVEGDKQSYNQSGALQFSDVSVDETTGSVQLRILFPNPDHILLPGLFVRAKIVQKQEAAAILVPQKAVTRNADGSVSVMLVGSDNKAVIQKIKVSDAVSDQWLVADGLKGGERLIIEGYQKAKPGMVVKPVDQAQAAAKPQAAAQQK